MFRLDLMEYQPGDVRPSLGGFRQLERRHPSKVDHWSWRNKKQRDGLYDNVWSAVIKKDAAAVQHYLEEWFDPNYRKGQLMKLAAQDGLVDILRLLMEFGGSYWGEAFFAACERGQLEVVAFMLEVGIDAELENGKALCLAVENGHIQLAEELVLARRSRTSLHNGEALRLAVKYRQAKTASILLANGGCPSAEVLEELKGQPRLRQLFAAYEWDAATGRVVQKHPVSEGELEHWSRKLPLPTYHSSSQKTIWTNRP